MEPRELDPLVNGPLGERAHILRNDSSSVMLGDCIDVVVEDNVVVAEEVDGPLRGPHPRPAALPATALVEPEACGRGGKSTSMESPEVC
ncbi:unnamed protein product [Taenia asiatica]|uniref:DUF5641 domain-containing protein n=1 Tax=Taenia asiatica TaxID=60517 RepID=A0A0R3WHC1_TAEAS|nr:unnamed protein product [Taenia asiatica]